MWDGDGVVKKESRKKRKKIIGEAFYARKERKMKIEKRNDEFYCKK